MHVLVIDPQGASLDFCLRCQEAGHKVKLALTATEKNAHKIKYIGKGLVEQVFDWRVWAAWADLVILADNTKYLKEIDVLRRRGTPVIGPTDAAAEWELDRDVGMKVFKKYGIECPPSKAFDDYDKAIAYVKREARAFVSKPSGDADKALSYVGKTPADLCYMLERWKKLGKLKNPFLLQEKVDGCEMAVGGWFGPGGFSSGWCENWEFKKLCDHDRGPATGEQGTIVRYVKKSKLADKVLKPLEEALEAVGHSGYVDVNCIIDEKGQPWPLEFTMRPGWPTFNIQQVIHSGDPVEWLAELAAGRDARNLVLDTVACGVVLSIPDYPYGKFPIEDVIGIPIYGIDERLRPWIHPSGVMAGDAPHDVDGAVVTMPCWVTAEPYVMIVSGTGDTVEASRRAAYSRIKRVSLPNSPMWRSDIGQRLRGQLPGLQEHGYATGLIYG